MTARLARLEQAFPTRHYPYRARGMVADAAPAAATPPELPAANTLFRRVMGIDATHRPMTAAELVELADPMGKLLRSGQPFPLSARQVLLELDGLGGSADALPDQLVFLVADGGHVRWTPETDRLQRAFRFLVARGRGEFPLLISASTLLDSADAFLQVIGWDDEHEVYHFYERLFGTFFWAGTSLHALDDATRGQGPFDSHVNGALVMKELRAPWIHWHAPLAGIDEDAFDPADPLVNEPLFRQRVTADRLETEIVRPGVRRWNAARARKAVGPNGVWSSVHQFLRQAITDTTVNLASSDTASSLLGDDEALAPPLSFFINRDILFDTLGFEPGDPDIARIAIPGALYRACLQRYDVHRSDGSVRIEGDSHFAFLVPEAALEDTNLADEMVQRGLLTRKFLACLSMTDFTNPVFSDRRAALLRYAPVEVSGGAPGELLATHFVAAIAAAVAAGRNGAAAVDSPEREFLANWQTPDHETAFVARIEAYFLALRSGMADAATVDGWFRLAEFRRRRFRERKLAEFQLTTPRTSIPPDAPALRMTASGRAEDITRRAAMNRFDPPGFLDDLTEAQKNDWSGIVSGWLDQVRHGRPDKNDGPRGQFFNPLTAPPDADAQVAVISWNAFPRQVRSTSISDRHRWRRADADRNLQDEYCEWSVTRDPATGKIIRVTFTCEGPEYWVDGLAAMNPGKVLELYREFISPEITTDDLFVDGVYQPLNRFNDSTTRGAMHLIQPANTLRAEIELGAAATIRRLNNGQEVTDAQALILCSRYGAPGRNSDPFIGGQVNALARLGADITFNNPIGLYFHDFNPVGWVTPDGVDARRFWKYVRGKDDHFVRAVFEVPPERGYVVADIKIAGRGIEFGAQIADFVTIKLEGLATRIGQSSVQPFNGCKGAAQPPGALNVAASAGEAAEASATTRSSGTVASAASANALAAAETVLERALLSRLPVALHRDAVADQATPDAAPPALRPYPPLPAEMLRPHSVSGRMTAYASPDSTYAVTKKLLDSAQRSIVIGLYDFSADYVKAHLKKAMRRGVTLSLMLDTNNADDPGLFGELRSLGANCVQAPSSSAGHPTPYFGNAHEKIVVIDGEIVMIQSGNWSENSIPFNEADGEISGQFVNGNRDMGLAVHSRSLARFFAELVARDMRLALGQPPDAAPPVGLAAAAVDVGDARAAEIFFEAAPPDAPPQLFRSLSVTPSSPVQITPVITPENYHGVARSFLASARQSIYIEQQYIRGGQPAIDGLLSAIVEAREASPGLDVRIVVSPKYLTGTDRSRFLKAMSDFGLEFDDNYRFLPLRHFVHCHNKLIVVDGLKVLLGSQNWSTTGVRTNREASLLVEHAGIAAYFAEIFQADWTLSAPPAVPTEALLGIGPESVVRASAFAEGGIVTSTVRDYLDV